MVYSICRSSEDLGFLAANSPLTPPELISDGSSDDEPEPASPVSSGPPIPPSDGIKLHHSRRTPVDVGILSGSSFRDGKSELPTIEDVLSGSDGPNDRGRARLRRYPNSGPPGRGSRSPVSPDRFIPLREFDDPPSTPFRVCKNPKRLSPDEKLLRRRLPRADPFLPARRRAMTVPKPNSQRVHSPHYGPRLVNDSSTVGSVSSQPSGDVTRQVSHGCVWNVGGKSAALAKPSLGIPDGTGGLLSSGTTAPMHTAEFFPQRALSEEPEKHESRIALALNIDPASRLLNTCQLSPSSPDSTPSPSSPDYERFSPFVWKDSAWKRIDGEQCKFKYL